MALADQAALIASVKILLGVSNEKISDTGYEQACGQAIGELGWTLPLDDARKCYWLVERAKRHSIYILMVESAYKFQYKQIHLEHRFKNYIQLIQNMDEAFYRALEEFPELFDGIDEGADFSFYINPGFVYDELGRDVTYQV